MGSLFKELKHLKKKSSTEVCSMEVRGNTEAAEKFYKPVSTYEMGTLPVKDSLVKVSLQALICPSCCKCFHTHTYTAFGFKISGKNSIFYYPLGEPPYLFTL